MGSLCRQPCKTDKDLVFLPPLLLTNKFNMKSIKFLSLLLFAVLSVAACKKADSTQTETTAGISQDSLVILKEATIKNLQGLQQAVNEKIAETEMSLKTATEAEKATLNANLEKYKTFMAHLQTAYEQVNNATADSWVNVEASAEAVHYEVKSFLVGDKPAEGQAAELNGGSSK